MSGPTVRPDGACCQWRKSPPRELSIDLVADERIGWVTGRAGVLDQEIACSDRTIAAMARDDEMARRLMTIPGLDPVTALAMAASVQDVSAFSGPREFAAFLGLTPRQNSSGGKEQLDRI